MGTEVLVDHEFGSIVENSSDVPSADVLRALNEQAPEIAALTRWGAATQGFGSRAGGLFDRDRYVTPEKFVHQMRQAYYAAEMDDVVAGVLESTEALAFSKMSFSCDDIQEEDIWNQIAADIDLDSRLREMWRELFTVSQFYAAVWWRTKSYRVRGKTDKGIKSKKTFLNLRVPEAISILDPLKVVPVGSPMFNRERLAWIADRSETASIAKALLNPSEDPIMSRLILGPYTPEREELSRINEMGFEIPSGNRLFLLNPQNVFRHTATKPQYQHVASVRMTSVFALLDLKTQLRAMDRAHLLGASNFIIVITKGSDAMPAKAEELANLQSQVRMVARIPVLVGDHRLNVEIVTPKTEFTLRPERYNTLDSRITARLYQMFVLGNYCLSEDTEIFTTTGWKRHEELQVGDLVLVVDPETQIAKWEPCQAVNRFQWSGPLTSYETRGLSALSTPNHRWFIYRGVGNGSTDRKWDFRTTETMTAWCNIPHAFPYMGAPVEPKWSDAFVELVAWYWTEGHDKADSAGIEISQSENVNMSHVLRIKAALEQELGPEGSGWSSWVYKGHRTFGLHAEFGRQLRSVAPCRVLSPTFLLELTQAQLGLLISRSLDGDGHTEVSGKTTLNQSDEDRIRGFEFACVLAGLPFHTTWIPSAEQWRITLKQKSFTNPLRTAYSNPRAVSQKDFSGIVWCPTTSGGTWLARRNGTVFWTGNSAGASKDNSADLVKVIARGMESRRHMLRRTLEKHVFDPIFEMNDQLTSEPTLRFHPKSIALDFDSNFASFLLELRMSNEISRETILSQFDLDQDDEAKFREREEKKYDQIFKTQVPFSTPNTSNQEPVNPKQAGRAGGRSGGAAPGTGQGKEAIRPRRKSDNDVKARSESAENELEEDSE